MLNSIDTHPGHAFLHSGDLYYSPNCARQVDVPEYTEHYRYPFHGREARFQKFLTPRWWTRPYHYLCFVPLCPSFEGEVFGVLKEFLTSIVTLNNRYMLSNDKLHEWNHLEDALIASVHALNLEYPTDVRGALRPTIPSLLGFPQIFSEERTARLKIAASRDWFLMWMTLLSSKIADACTINAAEDSRDWFTILVEDHRIPEPWLSAVKSSSICNFSLMHPRVGTFVNIHQPQPNQPKVEWFIRFNIPVWYCWKPGDPALEHLRPPAHVLQSATSFISKTPPLPLPHTSVPQSTLFPPHRPVDYTSVEYKNAKDVYLASKPWEAYFAAREAENQNIIAKESDSQRITRLNRERKPPVNCEVYEWEWSEDNSIELVRTSVPKKMRQEILSRYSDAQSRYDSVKNRWDVCEYFGDDDIDEEYDVFEDIGPDVPGNDHDGGAAAVEALIDQRTNQVQQASHPHIYCMRNTGLSVGPEISLYHSVGQVDIPQYLHLHYGFLRPIPVPSIEPPIDINEWAESLKCIGLDVKVNPPIVGLSNTIVNFIKGLQGYGPKESDWDMLTNNYLPIDMTVLNSYFRRLPNGHFLLDNCCVLDAQNWQIALTTSVNALFVVRDLINSPNQLSIQEVAQHLIEEGISFCTYSKLDRLPSSLPLSAIVTPIPRRGVRYKFSVADYEMYLSDRRRLLSTPRARAAILRGGIVGRLAKECIGIDDVLSGPSSAVNVYRLGHSVEAAGAIYWDDALTEDEMSVICGMFHCHTGMYFPK